MSPAPKAAEFYLQRSLYYLAARLLLIAIAGALIVLLPLKFWANTLGLLVLSVVGCWFVAQYMRQGPESLLLLDSAKNLWRLVREEPGEQDVSVQDVQLAPTQFVTRHLVIAYFRAATGRQIVRVIPSDGLSPQKHRLLRMILIARAKNRSS